MNRRTVTLMLVYCSMLVFFTLYVWIRIENSQFIREPRATFGDTHEFLDAANIPFFSKSFWISLRPPVVPLFYKIIGNDNQRISDFQLLFSIFSWSMLAVAIVNAVKSYAIKLVAFVLVLAFSLSEEIIMWDYIILGDSISISLMALFCASIILLLSKWSLVRLILFFLTGLLFTFVRDDFAYYILMMGAVSLLLLVSLDIKYWKHLILISVFCFASFFVSNTLSTASMRWYRPLLNTISIRILPNPQYVAYFESRGLPVTDALLERSGKHLHADDNALVVDLRLSGFRDWVETQGRSEYIKFLWFFKTDTFQNLFKDSDIIFSPNVFYYAATRFRPVITDARLNELLFPMKFGFLLFFMANLIAAMFLVVAFYEKRIIWFLPLILILLTYPQAFLVWNADANDMARHAIYLNIMLRLGMWILVVFVLDLMIEKSIQASQFLERKFAGGRLETQS